MAARPFITDDFKLSNHCKKKKTNKLNMSPQVDKLGERLLTAVWQRVEIDEYPSHKYAHNLGRKFKKKRTLEKLEHVRRPRNHSKVDKTPSPDILIHAARYHMAVR